VTLETGLHVLTAWAAREKIETSRRSQGGRKLFVLRMFCRAGICRGLDGLEAAWYPALPLLIRAFNKHKRRGYLFAGKAALLLYLLTKFSKLLASYTKNRKKG